MAEKLLSDKFREALRKSDFEDKRIDALYDTVEGMSDEDFKEYLYVNRKYFKQNMPAAVEEIEGFDDYVSVEPKWKAENIDYKKVTGSDDALSDDKFYSYDMKDMENFGRKVGMTGKEFLAQMQKDKVEKDRKLIAHGEDEGGWLESPKSFVKNAGGALMNLMAPRTQEAIERGEEPQAKDYLLDQAENLAEAVPMGKIMKVGKAVKPFALKNVAANTVVPLGKEVADAIAYDEENPRGGLDWADVAKGAAVNVVMPRALRKYGAEKWDEIGNKVTTKNVPVLGKVFGIGGMATPTDLITNKTGDVLYRDRSTPIPLVGTYLDNYRKEDNVNKEKEKNKEASTKRFEITPEKEKEMEEFFLKYGVYPTF